MVQWKKPRVSSQTKENDTSVTILIKSSKLPIKELEKITSLLLATLSTACDGKTIEIESKDLRISSSIAEGAIHSISIKSSF